MLTQLLLSWLLATTIQDLTLQNLVDHSETIVLAKAVKNQSYWQNKRIYTRSTFLIEDTWINRTSVALKQIDVIQLGGMVDDIGQRVDGMVETKPNDRMVLCLKRDKNNQWAVVGMSLGAFYVEDKNVTPQSKIQRKTKNLEIIHPTSESFPNTIQALKQKMLEAFHAQSP